MNDDVEDFLLYLEHAGVKGMKWGVRRERRRQTYVRGAVKVKEGGSRAAKVRTAVKLGPVDFIRGRGIVGGAKRKSARWGKQLERFDKGEATKTDLLKRYGLVHVTDLVPVKTKNVGKVRSTKADIAVVTAVGALAASYIIAGKVASTAARRM